MATKNLLIRGGADFSGMQKGLQKAQQSLNNFQKDVSNTMAKIGAVLGTLAIGKLVKDSTSMAMGVESAVDNINRNMGSAAKSFQEFVNTQSQALGMARADAYKYGSTFSNLLASFSSSSQETANKTQELMKAASIIASNTGRSYEDTAERIRSGMLGSTEAIEDLGIYTNIAMIESTNAFNQFANGKSWSQLDFQIQQQIRLAAILEQTYARYGDTLANTTQTRQAQLVASLKNVQLSLGQAFLPIYNAVLPSLIAMANAIGRVVSFIAQFMQALFGTKQAQEQVKSVSQQAGAVQDLGKSYAKAGKEAKKAMGSVAGFDEVNNLADQSSSGSGSNPLDDAAMSGSGGAIPLPELDNGGFISGAIEVSKKAQEMANEIKSTFKKMWGGLKGTGSLFADAFSGLGLAFQPIYDAVNPIKQSISKIGKTFLRLNDEFLKPSAKYILLDFIPSIVTGFINDFAPVFSDVAVWSMDLLSRTFKNVTSIMVGLWNGTWLPSLEKIKGVWVDMSSSAANSLQSLLDGTIKPLVDFLINGFILPIANKINEVLVPIFTDILVFSFKETAKTFEWAANMMNEIYQTVIKPVFELIKNIVLDTLQIVVNLWSKYGQELLGNLSKLFGGIKNTFQLLWDDVLEPIIKPFLEMLSWLWEHHLKGLVEEVGAFVMKLVNAALDILNKFILPIVDYLVKKLGPTFKTIFLFIADVIGTTVAFISDMIKGLLLIFGGIIDFIVGVFTGNWGKAWDGIVSVFKGIVELISGIFKGVLNITIDVINAAIGLVMNAINGLIQGAINLINAVPGIDIKISPISVPKIPKLARGGIVDGETNFGNYIAGEAGAEMIVPLENTSFVDKLAGALGTAVMSAMQFNGGSNSESGDIVLQLDGATFARVMGPLLDKEKQRVGNSMIVKTT